MLFFVGVSGILRYFTAYLKIALLLQQEKKDLWQRI
jgi:hypothetical protein